MPNGVFTRSSKRPANFQQTSSKHPAGLMEPRPLSAYQPISLSAAYPTAYQLWAKP